MSEDKSIILLLGEIKGTLTEFKDNADRRFDEIKNVANAAHSRADEAHEKADEAIMYAQGIVNKAGWVGTGVAATVTFLFWVADKIHIIPKAIASVFIGSH